MIRLSKNHIIFIIQAISICLSINAKATLDADSATMRLEADRFLSGIPSGTQQRQAQAVEAAINGETFLLDDVRNSRNEAYQPSTNVNVFESSISNRRGHEIATRLYTPSNQNNAQLPLLIYFHGGGWTFGSLNSCARFCNAIASTGKAAVLAVDYSLAPEHPFPDGLDDCIDAVKHTFENPGKWNTSFSSISVGGDSSGGNLAIATALYLQNERKSQLKSIVLFYPVVKAENDRSDSWNKYGEGYGLDSRLMDKFNKAYYSAYPPQRELISPSYASKNQLRALPPVLMISAERDILTDQGTEFAKRISDAGGNINRIILPGTVHLFITVSGQECAFRKSISETVSFLTK